MEGYYGVVVDEKGYSLTTGMVVDFKSGSFCNWQTSLANMNVKGREYSLLLTFG